MNNNREKYFFCYDIDKAKFLKSKGLDFVTRAYHYRSNQLFYLFERTEQLQQLIDEYDFINLKSKLAATS